MKLNSIKKIIPEDYSADNRDLIRKLASTLNGFLEQVSQALSLQLTLTDNLRGKVYSVNLLADVSTAKVQWTYPEKPTAVYIGQITKNTNKAAVAQAANLTWTYTTDDKGKGQISLTFFGLAASTIHDITIVALV